MMLSVMRYARESGIPCEVSLENRMACGIGACLCCIEPTVYGKICVCTEGPVFNMDELTWQI
jgi:dihydroorotate dehydrogenase electron transfer subunit